MFSPGEKISRSKYDKDSFMNLDMAYEITLKELALQQSKRDQIIAFYIAILGFVIPSLFVKDSAIGIIGMQITLGALYIIGLVFCHVIIRYRLYKESYWVASRVISQLNNIKTEERNKEMILSLYFHALKKNYRKVVKTDKDNHPSLFRSARSLMDSAETLLMETLNLVTVFVGGLTAYFTYTHGQVWLAFILAAVVLYFFLIINYKYCSRLMALYKCVEDEEAKRKHFFSRKIYAPKSDETRQEELIKACSKAWMLQCTIDDILETSCP